MYCVYDYAFVAVLKGIYYIFSAKNPDESELDEALNNVVSNSIYMHGIIQIRRLTSLAVMLQCGPCQYERAHSAIERKGYRLHNQYSSSWLCVLISSM